jgi:uncharacterized protein
MKPRSRTSRFRARSLFRTLTLGALALAAALVAADLPLRGASPDLVISQVYGGGGNTYKNDFVELYNRGSAPVSLDGRSVQYASATGTGNFSSNPITPLSGTLQPGQYFLVQMAGGSVGAALPTPDAIGTVNLSATGGKVALINSTAGLACNGGSTPCSAAQLAQIIDLVGWDGANFYEGSAAAPATTNTTAALRKGGGAIDSDNNSLDFVTATPTPRNTGALYPTGIGVAGPSALEAGGSTLLTVKVTAAYYPPPTSTGITVAATLAAIGGLANQQLYDDGSHGDVLAGDNVFSFLAAVPVGTPAGGYSLAFVVQDAQGRSSTGSLTVTVAGAPISIHDIQGPGLQSPYTGQVVNTFGIVTARRYNNGFFIQTPDDLADVDPNTSEAVFVYTGGAPPDLAAVGAYVQVIGSAAEYVPSADPYSPPTTEITSPFVTLAPATWPMPSPITLTAADLPTSGTPEQLERYEGMRVYVPSLVAVSPTEGSVIESSATGSSNGVFYGVIYDPFDMAPRPFREAGIQVGDALPSGAPSTVPRFDLNPERLRVNSWGQINSTRIDVTTGTVVSNLVGVLDYTYRTWTLLTDLNPVPPITVSTPAMAVPVPDPDANEFTVASFNLERFFDTVDDPNTSDVRLTPAAFSNRLNKASLAVRKVMRTPDIIGVQEVENLSTLQSLAAKINTDAVTAGGPNPGYVAYLEEGNDPGGIDVGFLVRSSRVNGVTVVQEGKDATYIDPNTGLPALLNDRPPLVLTAQVNGTAIAQPVTVIVNHLRSLDGVADLTDGRVRAKRLAQAEFLANLIQARQAANPGEQIISVGDYNAYEFSDGYVDVVGSIKGIPAPYDQVVLTGPDLVNPDLTDLTALAPAAERYSYSYDGSAQLLDHIIVNNAVVSRFSRLSFARSNADFPELYRTDANRPERVSDHDMPVAYFMFHKPATLVLNGANPMTVELGDAFVDPGATATDEVYGDISQLVVATGQVNTSVVGSYTVTYSVNNGFATTTVTRVVNVLDTTPPVMSAVVPTVSFLWPPNHQLESVGLRYTATDKSGAPVCSVSVASSEPLNGTGDGDTSPDWLLSGDRSVQLRAERAGTGPGRVYTVTVTCRDESGNSTLKIASVTVPKSMGNGKK